MKIIKKLLIVMILMETTLMACGPGGFDSYFAKENYYNFLDASLVGVKEGNPLYSLTSYGRAVVYETRLEYYDDIKRQMNVKEWYKYLKGKVTEKEIEHLLYSNQNSLLKRYERYAKKIDNQAFGDYLKAIASPSLKALAEEQDPFLKLRYLFLNMRVAHYGGKYQKTLDIYAKYGDSVSNVKSIVHEWIDALRAGALQHLKRDVESNLLYAKVLENKTNAHLGYYDFKVEDDAQWSALLAKAKTTDEKANLYFLRALKWEGSALLEHEKLAQVAPNSKWFERLTYMIMQNFQEDFYRYEQRKKSSDEYWKSSYKVYLLKEKRFLKTLNSLKNPSFFSLYSVVYLNFLKEKKLKRSGMLRLKQVASKKIVSSNEKIFIEILYYLEKSLNVTSKSQKALYASFEKLSSQVTPSLRASLFNYTALCNIKLYPSMSAKRVYSKIFADSSLYSQFVISRDGILADSFEAYVEEKNRNFFEKNLFKKSMKLLEKNAVAKTLAYLYIKDGNFKKAQKYLNEVPSLNNTTEFNPFNVSLSGNNRKVKGKGYSQRKFVKTMLQLEENIRKNPTSAMEHFLYATGRYNSTWFGNFTQSASVWRTLNGFDDEEAKHMLYNYDAIEKEYALALKYAKDDEFKAKIAYQMLKIKLNREVLIPSRGSWLVTFGVDWDDEKSLREQVAESTLLNKAYSRYVHNYKDTQYGKEIIKACATFKYFK